MNDKPIVGTSGGTAWWENPTTLSSRHSERHQTSNFEVTPRMRTPRPTRHVLVRAHELPRPTRTPQKEHRAYAGINPAPPSHKSEPTSPRGVPGLIYIGLDKHENAKRPYANGLTREQALLKWQEMREEGAERAKSRASVVSADRLRSCRSVANSRPFYSQPNATQSTFRSSSTVLAKSPDREDEDVKRKLMKKPSRMRIIVNKMGCS
ncbi:uncharacterized protein BDZ99DRAFT_546056 [Mytilinidion resinicola]|uniref:Uncharacterized protein n=1 Tax=Mytilinidion resinicola TaxID=574789 RepID=A0A6A6Y5M3_9PEZI|nr:uncharacterized protein BDZ99DRAFT_546056 [Mytilinidion resinicola]KAF2804092.1 hypothetical protein BDZ99DRAFT_546056 [Mytilinidion resinicola]